MKHRLIDRGSSYFVEFLIESMRIDMRRKKRRKSFYFYKFEDLHH